MNQVTQSSKGIIKLIRVFQVEIILEGKIFISILDMYFKSSCMPILWKK